MPFKYRVVISALLLGAAQLACGQLVLRPGPPAGDQPDYPSEEPTAGPSTNDELDYPWEGPTAEPSTNDQLELEYIGSFSFEVTKEPDNQTWEIWQRLEPGSYVRDVWVLTNPTDSPLSFEGVLRIRDANGAFIEDRGLGRTPFPGCPGPGSTFGAITAELILLPPHTRFVLHVDTPAEEALPGATRELRITSLATCPGADKHGHYDPRVTLSFKVQGRELEAVIQNDADTPAVGGTLYMNAYAADGTPVYGSPVDISLSGGDLGLPPGEKHVRSVPLPETFVEAADYQFIW